MLTALQLETPFQLQEYLKSFYSKLTRDETSDTVKPLTKETAIQLATPPIQQDTGEPVDRNLWLYELCRFLVLRSNRLIVNFFGDSPPCSSQTCPEMRASEWQYLCAVHEPPKSCCAIDYCCHTLDWAANVLTSTKHFPSRLSLGGEGGNVYQSMRQLTNIFRRVYRIYAHAWFQHREVFWSLEQEEGLYKFFKTVCDAYQLIPEDNYTIPSEAEGDREEETPINEQPSVQILRNETQQQPAEQPPEQSATPEPGNVTGATTRRHRHTPSTGTQVTMIAEGVEEEEDEESGTLTQFSQPSMAELTATSTIQEIDPSQPSNEQEISQGVSRIEMPSSSELRAPEEPTPTPENHTSDPFDKVSSPAKPVSSSPPKQGTTDHPPAISLNTSSPALKSRSSKSSISSTGSGSGPTARKTRRQSSDAGETIHSPGGGSIRTIGPDILAGILAHEEGKEDDIIEEDEEHDGDDEEGDDGNVITHTSDSTATGVPKKTEKDGDNDSDDEEMGEIKLPEKYSPKIGEDPSKDQGEDITIGVEDVKHDEVKS